MLSVPRHLRDLVTPTSGTELCWWLGTPKKNPKPSTRVPAPPGPSSAPPQRALVLSAGPSRAEAAGGSPATPRRARRFSNPAVINDLIFGQSHLDLSGWCDGLGGSGCTDGGAAFVWGLAAGRWSGAGPRFPSPKAGAWRQPETQEHTDSSAGPRAQRLARSCRGWLQAAPPWSSGTGPTLRPPHGRQRPQPWRAKSLQTLALALQEHQPLPSWSLPLRQSKLTLANSASCCGQGRGVLPLLSSRSSRSKNKRTDPTLPDPTGAAAPKKHPAGQGRPRRPPRPWRQQSIPSEQAHEQNRDWKLMWWENNVYLQGQPSSY